MKRERGRENEEMGQTWRDKEGGGEREKECARESGQETEGGREGGKEA